MPASRSFRSLRSSAAACGLTLATVALAAACASEPSAPPAQQAVPAGDAQARWFAHVEFLANDEMRGRETGSPEHRKAAEYIAAKFKAAGLAPGAPGGYLQPVSFRRGACSRPSRASRW